MQSFLKASLVWTGIIVSLSAYGQYIPLGALPMQYNGSFAGEAGAPRMSTNSQYYGPKRDNLYYVTAFGTDISYDQFIPKLHSGIGFTAGLEKGKRGSASSWSGNQVHSWYRSQWSKRYFSIDVAPKFSINGKYTLSPSIDFNYIKVESEDNRNEKSGTEGFHSRIGLLWNTPKYYIGFSFNGFSHIKHYYQQSHYKSPYRIGATLQLGYTFQKNSASKFSFTPQIAFNLLDIVDRTVYLYEYNWGVRGFLAGFNLNFRYSKFIWGLNNAGLHVGLQTDKLRLMVTNLPPITGGNSYTGNLSLRYVFKEKSREN